MGLSPRLSVRDVFVIVLVTTGLAAFCGAVVDRNRETANRIKCASNLRQLGTAIALYANENRGAYPRTTSKADQPPVWGTPYADDGSNAKPNDKCDPFINEKDATRELLALRPKANDVTAALYLLLRTQDLVPEVFVCPSSRAKRFEYDGKGSGAMSYTNFPGKDALARHLSYSYQNAYPSPKAVGQGFKLNNSLTAEFAAMADMNPGGEDVKKLTEKSDRAESSKGNSKNHQGDGQNVLYGDGHIEFVQTPLAGVKLDNIYVANDAVDGAKREGEPSFTASPADANDSILLPTAADIGQEGISVEPATPAADPAALVKQIKGTFAQRNDRGRPVVLTIDDTTFKAVSGPTTVAYIYKIVGTRGKAIVVSLIAPDVAPIEAELKLTEQSLYVDTDETTGAISGGWARRAER